MLEAVKINRLGVRSFGMIRKMVDQVNDESTLDKDSSVHLIYHDPSDLGSLILMRIMPKERTLGFPISDPLGLGRRLVSANTTTNSRLIREVTKTVWS